MSAEGDTWGSHVSWMGTLDTQEVVQTQPGGTEPLDKLSVSVWVPWALLQNSTSFSVGFSLISSLHPFLKKTFYFVLRY